jgi:hypothetical protein
MNRAHSRRFARFGYARQSRSVWSACVFSAALPRQADSRWPGRFLESPLLVFSACIGTMNRSESPSTVLWTPSPPVYVLSAPAGLVAQQTVSLPCRRMPSCGCRTSLARGKPADTLPIDNRRNGRLPICATLNTNVRGAAPRSATSSTRQTDNGDDAGIALALSVSAGYKLLVPVSKTNSNYRPSFACSNFPDKV